jgi:small-conductance mechanosensitive channel/CRP-like cAMP-binding protein
VEWLAQVNSSTQVAFVVAACLILLLPVLLPAGTRGAVKAPLAFLVVAVLLMFAHTLDEPGRIEREPLRVTSIFFLGLSCARSFFLILLHSVVTKMLGGDVPRIVRDLIQALLYTGVVFNTLRSAGVELGSLLTTSALLTAVIGLSLQDTLGNLFAGLAIQAQRPFRVGDWIQFDDVEAHIGQVVEMNWRAVKVLTLDEVEIMVPNGTLAKAALRNFTLPTAIARRHAYVEAPYGESPEKIMPELLEALRSVDGVIWEPEPTVLVLEFNERGVRYEVRYYIDDFERREQIGGAVRERLWYALQRLGIEIPVPQRQVRMYDLTEERLEHEAEARVAERDQALRSVDFLEVLPDSARHVLAEHSILRMYAPGESIIEQGDRGEEFFIIQHGETVVEVGEGASRKEVARVKTGQFFGEMSLMTGEKRTASVTAVRETVVLVIHKHAVQSVLEKQPELAETISKVLARRSQELIDAEIRKTLPGEVARIVENESSVLLQRIKRFFSIG